MGDIRTTDVASLVGIPADGPVAIVKDLAAGTSPHDHEFGDCILCDKITHAAPVRPEDHHPQCPWRRAREWVAANPEPT